MGMQRLLQCFFLVGTVFVTFFIIIFWDEMRDGTFSLHTASSQDLTHLKLRQAHRRHVIRELCSANSSLNFTEKLITFDQIPNKALDHLIVDDHHGVIYCFVPKVACTNWKRVMIVLSQNLKAPNGTPYLDPLDVPPALSHNTSLHLTFNNFRSLFGNFSSPLMHQKLKNYTKFLFVRDPFVRLISAFRDKFARPNKDFYRHFGSTMLQRYANISNTPDSAQEAFTAGIRLSFTHFIQYLLDPQTEKKNPFNEHWQQIYRLCHPCQIDYDFVGKMETLDEDTEHLLKILGLEKYIHFPPGYKDRTSVDWERDWFANISIADRRKLYNLYETDFRLFEYEKPETLLDE
ncbi:carbohydrate sulfotransferase 12-like [Ctenopharyngodon idella]|uniref:carbohydrate sulfotransferase 12-like n=1 Tax=Ctenopharyngodon idella TaxID=7959 RepID=UPI00222E8552|nr:carbohydrate sulfotransferase 12-like [Ctenopharyngodon idella]XP_051748121.1 carbohydrate sulfotransferase 12-like [Ctenopharyngodon idella]XP_051748186.1 carbohydrate sulfotransferase 12-like [Ctenopharyngodon idella]